MPKILGEKGDNVAQNLETGFEKCLAILKALSMPNGYHAVRMLLT